MISVHLASRCRPLVNLSMLKNRNFALMTMVGLVLYSTITLLPLFLQNLMAYSALDSGLALSPRGIGAVLAMFFVSRAIGKIDSRILIGRGFTALAYIYCLFGQIALQISIGDIAVPNVVMGFAMGLIFVPLTTLTMGGLPNEQMGNAAGIFNLMRNLGGSIGISAVTTLLSRGEQTHQSIIAGHLNQYNPLFRQYVQKLQSLFALRGTPDFSDHKTYQTLYNLVLQQATLLSYLDNFRLLAYVCALCLPAVFLLRQLSARSGPICAH